MNYIVFDLEWNQCPYGKDREDALLPFEIIEIGAVKLDSERNIISSFSQVVKPRVYQNLHYRTSKIVHLTKKELNNGKPFPEAVRDFFTWIGSDAEFCTWGTVDLPELQRNLSYYHMLDLLKGPMHFLDVQKLFAVQYENTKTRRALEYAVDYFGFEKDQEFHSAYADALYTAKVLQKIDPSIIWTYDSIDVYQHPERKEDEIHAVYNGYTKYISREFASKEDAMADPEVRSTHCCICGKRTRKKLYWFSVGAKNYYCTAFCPEHGYIKGKIRMIHSAQNDNVFVVKTIKVSGETEAEEFARKKQMIRLKRRIKA